MCNRIVPSSPQAEPLPPDTVPFKPLLFEQPCVNFLFSSNNYYIYKPITLDANGQNIEDEMYKVINRTRTDETRILREYTALYHGLFYHPHSDIYYIRLNNLTHWLEPNPSVMIIDMTMSSKSFRIIGQQVGWEVSEYLRKELTSGPLLLVLFF